MIRGNISVHDWRQKVGSEGFADPTTLLEGFGCNRCDGAIVALGGQANSRWSYNVSGLYQLPWRITVGGNVHGREGFVLSYFHQLNAGDGGGNKNVLVDGVDPARLPDVFLLDLRLAKEVRLRNRLGVTLSADVFNVTGEATVLQRNRRLANTVTRTNPAANRVMQVLSPRVIRFGARLAF